MLFCGGEMGLQGSEIITFDLLISNYYPPFPVDVQCNSSHLQLLVQLFNLPLATPPPVTQPDKQLHNYYRFGSKFASENNVCFICNVWDSSAHKSRNVSFYWETMALWQLLSPGCSFLPHKKCKCVACKPSPPSKKRDVELVLPILVRRRPLPRASWQISKVSQGATVALSPWVSG